MDHKEWEEFVECLDETVEELKVGIFNRGIKDPDERMTYVREHFTLQMVKDIFIRMGENGYESFNNSEVLSELMFRKFKIKERDTSDYFDEQLVSICFDESKSMDDFAEKMLETILAGYIQEVVYHECRGSVMTNLIQYAAVKE